MARAKICGLTQQSDVRAAVEAGADAVGFIVDVDVESPREIEPAHAERLIDAVPPFVTSVLVTMPDSAASAVALAELVGADALQVHGLAPDDCAVAAQDFYGPVVAAVSTEEVTDYASAADALLVDTPSTDGGGGTGETHDWAATRDAAAAVDRPMLLAGGLTPDNVAEAVETVRPHAVDVASGVESAGGVKDHDAVDAFVTAAQEAR